MAFAYKLPPRFIDLFELTKDELDILDKETEDVC